MNTYDFNFLFGFDFNLINEIMNGDFSIFRDNVADVPAFDKVHSLNGVDDFLLWGTGNINLVLLASVYSLKNV